MMHQLKFLKAKRRRAAALGMLCVSAILCLQGLLTRKSIEESEYYGNDLAELENDAQLHRYLLQTLDESNLMEDYDAAPSNEGEEPEWDTSPIGTKNQTYLKTLTSYTLEDAINEADVFRLTFAVMVYDPESDKFLGFYSKNHLWASSLKKLEIGMRVFAFMLRKTFPERFTRTSPELAISVSGGDYPHVHLQRLPHSRGVAPVLQFGSAFRDTNLYPNMIAMPMPGLHLDCFGHWADYSGHWADYRTVCGEFRSTHSGIGLSFGEELGLEWDNLKPQMVWRGTDFQYLPTLIRPQLSQPLNNVMEQMIDKRKAEQPDQRSKMRATAEVLREKYNELLPRWKGVLLTAEAELAAKNDELPWANIKFSRYVDAGHKSYTVGSAKYEKFEEVGVAVGEYMSHEDLAKFKYQIDFGGGGGTTWTGTISKLPMPGLLFHHITPTKDYFHDRLKPWKHFVPVLPDLSDLKEKFDWAESNPNQAKKIADQATEFMRYLGTPEGFGQMFEEDFVEPLRRIIDAYQPISTTHPGKTLMDVLQSSQGSKMVRILECTGLVMNSCEIVGGEVVEQWKKQRRYPSGH